MRRVLREQGATEDLIRSVEAGLAAAVVAAHGKNVNERVAIHLSQQRARSGKRRRRQVSAGTTNGRTTPAAESGETGGGAGRRAASGE